MKHASTSFVTLCPHCEIPFALPDDCCARCGHPMACDDDACRQSLPLEVRPQAVVLKDWLAPGGGTLQNELADVLDLDAPL